MEFMLLFKLEKGNSEHDRACMAEMGRLAAELADQKILKRGAPLAGEETAAWARVRGGKPLVHDGPFAESKEVIAGFWIIDVPDRDAAIEIAKRCPHVRRGPVEAHRSLYRGEFGDSETGKPFLLIFRMEPNMEGEQSERGKAMMDFGGELVDRKILVETGRLADGEPPARVEMRAGRPFVTDGPFAESKETVGGYAVIRVTSRDEAIDLGERFPHARWGPVEIREILFFDRV